MRIRTKLALAFVLFAILPLLGLVLYSYWTSQQALAMAIETEADAQTREMQRRLVDLEAGVARDLELVGPALLHTLDTQGASRGQLLPSIIERLGDGASLIESFEIEGPPQPSNAVGGVDEVEPNARERWVVRMEELAEIATEYGRQSFEGTKESVPPAVELGLEAVGELARDGMIGEIISAAIAAGTAGDDPERIAARDERLQAIGQELEARVEQFAAEGARRLEIIAARRQPPRSPGAPQPPPPLFSGRETSVFDPEGRVVGRLRPRLDVSETLARVMGGLDRSRGEIPFARAADGTLYLLDEAERPAVEALLPQLDTPPDDGVPDVSPVPSGAPESTSRQVLDDWVVVQSRPRPSGVVFGIASPLGSSIESLRRAAVRNFGWGVALIALALVGVLPLTRRLTRDLDDVSVGVERVAEGDLSTEIPVRSRDEIGRLARSFNRMAKDLRENQEKLVDQALSQRMLEVELARKTGELEAARKFQISMLPTQLPQSDWFEVAVTMRTATEVGGDYYDFVDDTGDGLTVAVGDATGHGASAGRMVTVAKSLLTSRGAGRSDLGDLPTFLGLASATIKRMALGRMTMALGLFRFTREALTVAAAGMPPALIFRAASRRVEEITVEGPPLGSLDHAYRERTVPIAAGDIALLMTDGFPELLDHHGEPLGYEAAREAFGAAATATGASADGIIAALDRSVTARTGDAAPGDDVTFVVVRFC